MSVRIKDTGICTSCGNQDCCFKDAQIRTNFYGIRSETTVCPTTLLSDNPINIAKDDNIIRDKNCINCGLCTLSCHRQNLSCDDFYYEDNPFENLSEPQLNSIACSYLGYLFGFAANTNRNRAMQFDGYVSTNHGVEAFVEVDKENDSLESVRRLIGDFLLCSPTDRAINTGIVVLNDIPKAGSRDVYEVVKKLSEFPTTDKYQIYFTTFRLLRLLALNLKCTDFSYSDLLLDIKQSDAVVQCMDNLIKRIPKLKRQIMFLLGCI